MTHYTRSLCSAVMTHIPAGHYNVSRACKIVIPLRVALKDFRLSLFRCDWLLHCFLDVTATERCGFEKLEGYQTNKAHI
jgi:hypothetical protein